MFAFHHWFNIWNFGLSVNFVTCVNFVVQFLKWSFKFCSWSNSSRNFSIVISLLSVDCSVIDPSLSHPIFVATGFWLFSWLSFDVNLFSPFFFCWHFGQVLVLSVCCVGNCVNSMCYSWWWIDSQCYFLFLPAEKLCFDREKVSCFGFSVFHL